MVWGRMILTCAIEASGMTCLRFRKACGFNTRGSESCQERKRASRSDRGTPWTATVAPVRRNGKELEREAQADTDSAARLKPVWVAVLSVHRQWTSAISEDGIPQGCSVLPM